MAGILALGVAPARVLDTISTSIAKANFTPRTPPATLTAGSPAAEALATKSAPRRLNE
jgi:hypothetical protein